ncbi:hypothetical protein B0H14DRAFT_2848863 [Mycena olivaceomarginata]|nr:hypothetical protein B0H14DRAFT_2848863 [Mycena olivaceomarginata]
MAVPNVRDDICVGFAAFTILVWDHIDTLATEVEYIWKGKKGIIEKQLCVSRTILLTTNQSSYLSPVWTNEARPRACCHFIRFEGAITVIGIHVVGIMMLLRIGALYSTQCIVVGAVFVLWLVMFSVNAWLLTRGEAVLHNPESGVRACTMIFPPELSAIASSSAWLPLLYDSVVVLTLRKTLPLLKKGSGTFMVKRLLEDGLIYYAAIFSVTLVLMIMIISAPPVILYSHIHTAEYHHQTRALITMISRITLNLKKCAQERLQSTILREPGSIVFQSVMSAFPTTPVDAERGYRNPDW